MTVTMRARLAGWLGTDNPNALAYALYSVLIQLSNGALFSGLTVLYLTLVTQSKTEVGAAEGVFGGCGLLPGIVGGYLADHWRRDRTIYIGAVATLVSTLALIGTLLATVCSDAVDRRLENTSIAGVGNELFLVLCIFVSCIYAGESLMDAASGALMSDSVATGARLAYNSRVYVPSTVARALGPTLLAVVSLGTANSWSERDFGWMMVGAALLRLPATVVCFWFADDKALGHESAAVGETAAHGAASRGTRQCCPARVQVPLLYFASDLLWCFGSGMTVKFFPVFFKEALGMSPAAVFLLASAVVAWCIPFAWLSEWLAPRLGRVQTDILLWYIGIASFGGVIAIGYTTGYTHTTWCRVVCVGLYLLRSGIINSLTPLQESIVMDYVPKGQRARWQSLQAVAAVGWSGSAAVGGYLIQTYSYELAFAVTSMFHVLSVVVKYPLLFTVAHGDPQRRFSKWRRRLAIAQQALRRRRSALSAPDAELVLRFAGVLAVPRDPDVEVAISIAKLPPGPPAAPHVVNEESPLIVN